MAVVTIGSRPSDDPATAARIAKACARFAVFDLDRTLLPGSSLGIFARGLSAAGLIRRWDVARHVVHQGVFVSRGLGPRTLERLCAEMAGAARGHRQADVAEVARSAAPSIAGRLYPGARLLLEMHRSAGDQLLLLSAGPAELVGAVADALGIETSIGTTAEVEDGQYTGRLDGPFCHGAGKLERLRTVLGPVDLIHTTAYGDSASDLPVLRAVATPVAVNPDRALAGVAAAQRWPVLRFD